MMIPFPQDGLKDILITEQRAFELDLSLVVAFERLRLAKASS